MRLPQVHHVAIEWYHEVRARFEANPRARRVNPRRSRGWSQALSNFILHTVRSGATWLGACTCGVDDGVSG